MSKEEEYRNHATKTVELAQRAEKTADKSRLMALAEGWLELAQRATKSPVERLRRLAAEPAVTPKTD